MTDFEGTPEAKITLVYNGVEPLCTPASESVAKLRRELMLHDESICLMIARLHEEKGFKVLFDAIPIVVSHVPNMVVLVAGEGPHRATLAAGARRRGLDHMVRFLGQRSDIPELISLASVVVLPSLAESFGFVLLEAMSLGKPVVASTTGGIPEVVSHGETGLLVPPGDVLSLADSIIRVLLQPDLAAELATKGKQRARLFTFDKMIRGYECVYADIELSRFMMKTPEHGTSV